MKICNRLAIILFFFLSPIPLAAGNIDLAAGDMYITKGFDLKWTGSMPRDSSWLYLPALENGLRSIRVKDMDIPSLPKRKFLSLRSFKPEHFTIVTSFAITQERIHGPVQGIYVKDIGQNWEVYINGHLVRSEVHLDGEGYITSHRNYRDVLIPVNPYTLKQGQNILALHIIGDPTDVSTGLYKNGPYLIGDYESLDEMRSEKIRLVLMFTYLFVGLYHLLLFFYRRTEKFNLAFGVATLFIFFYFFSRTYSIYLLIPDTNILFRIEFAVLFLILPAGAAFFDLLLFRKVHLFTMIFTGFYVLLALLVVAAPTPFCVDILRIWQTTALIPLMYILVNVARNFIADVRTVHGGGEGKRSFAGAALSVLGGNVSGNLLIGIFVIVLSAAFDIIDAVFLSLDIGLSKYTFLAVVVGMTVILANRFIYVHRQIEVLNTDLEEKLHELHSANDQISLSEARYKALVEGANDVVFTLDEEWNFISSNRTMEKYLKIKQKEITKWNFLDLVYEGGDDVSMNREIVRETLEEFKREKKPINFRAELTSAFGKEPKVMRIRMQYITIEGKNEILGMASSEVEDSLLKYFITEKQKYIIENFLITADEVSRRITRNLVRYLEPKSVDLIRLALREIIINAIEHGNLHITFEEKSVALIDGDYMELVGVRQNDNECRQKKVTVEYSLSPKRVIYLIMDEGEGFDFTGQMNESEEVNARNLPHGRGITMARNVFDDVQYMEKGNAVQLTKNFSS
ncbi:MAG: hypothetical protein CVV44_17060 [Spirochaetae bacterium HGW-Spirochaetae-1]|jgi:anti-sigma regulatory factor (Ser/Thr protein kinase)|nr:MAG: hypothetical protein CVV44_17060 [Spirochaetae bacterium HGW-Spirochaetae-1]